jgi:hypothetical protein
MTRYVKIRYTVASECFRVLMLYTINSTKGLADMGRFAEMFADGAEFSKNGTFL